MSATKIPPVIARLDRAIQYSKASVIDPRKPGVLDASPSRGMTVLMRGLTVIARSASDEAIRLSFSARDGARNDAGRPDRRLDFAGRASAHTGVGMRE